MKKKLFYSLLLVFTNIVTISSQEIQEIRSYHGLGYEHILNETNRLYLDTITIIPRDDNDNSSLLTRYRIWWNTAISAIPTDRNVTLNINGDGWRGRKYVVPVFSYDNKNWEYFPDSCVTDNDGAKGLYNYSVSYQFINSNVYVARTYPYPPSRIEDLIEKYKNRPCFRYKIIGYSQMGYPLYLFKITHPDFNDSTKKSVWVHSRTHPAETQSSFVLEGMIDYIMESVYTDENPIDISEVIYYIIPIVNIDGIVVGNSRLTPQGEDLEREWYRDANNDRLLADSNAKETKIIANTINSLIDEGAKFSVALNLHGKNAKEDEGAFLYTNFKKSLKKHGKAGDDLFKKQLHFSSLVSKYNCVPFVVRLGYTPNKPMQEKHFSESWWWANFKDKVMAATVEVPCSKVSCTNERVDTQDFYMLGKALAIASYDYTIWYGNPYSSYLLNQLDLDELMKYYHRSDWER
ncbi:MAG: hypothetical protein B7C24_15875 [Bacteroidetes bacterium 4572_77]|nr:MAG: hypothetical protein B7C24_15875 [Bacteroidetes bacterium 4572_77]